MKKMIKEILTSAGIEENEAKIEAEMITESGKNPLEIAKLRAETRRPLQQLLGFAYFYNEKFTVNEHTLIPRVDTEILVDETRKIIEKTGAKEVLDIGTGSGIIAVMLAKLTEATILGVDISLEALEIAILNAQRFNVINRAIFRKSDVFSNVQEKFDIIVSNPPYIKKGEKLQKEVEFDPAEALFAGDEGLYFYKKIIEEAGEHLKKGGNLIFEVGFNQAEKVAEMFEKRGFEEIEIIKDLSGIKRVVRGVINN